MNRRHLMMMTLGLALALPVSRTAAQGWTGDDGFGSVPCCTPLFQSNIPQAPPFQQMRGSYACIKDCNLEAKFDVLVDIRDVPVTCDYHVMPITVTPVGPGGPGYSSIMLAKYARTWLEFDATGATNRQVYRYLVNSDFTPTAGTAPCPLPSETLFGLNVHFHGHVDFACEIGPTGPIWSALLSLHHLEGCIEHNAFGCLPLPAPFNDLDRSYHLVASSAGAPFSWMPVPEPMGPTPAESFRSTNFANFSCFGEAPVRQGQIDTVSKSWLCQTPPGGIFNWCHQLVTGIIDCGGAIFPFTSLPIGAPLPPLPTGFGTLPLGMWTGAPGGFPGDRMLVTHWGVLDMQDPCNAADIPLHVVQGVSTINAPGVIFQGPAGAVWNVFMDFQDMLLPSIGIPGSYQPGWGCIFFSKRVWNLNMP